MTFAAILITSGLGMMIGSSSVVEITPALSGFYGAMVDLA
jgi:hypothetical protein